MIIGHDAGDKQNLGKWRSGISCAPAFGLLETRPRMTNPPPAHDDIHSEEFLRRLMRRQLRLSIACALTFTVVLLGMPLANYFFPEIMEARVFGFTLSWLILGILFFPFVWIIAWVFIRRSMVLEAEEVRSSRK